MTIIIPMGYLGGRLISLELDVNSEIPSSIHYIIVSWSFQDDSCEYTYIYIRIKYKSNMTTS